MTDEERKIWLQERIDTCRHATKKLEEFREYCRKMHKEVDNWLSWKKDTVPMVVKK